MHKKDLLKSVAEKAYDVGFGAKKHFATYDIIEKTPGMIGFLSLSFGIFALVFKSLSTEISSAIFIILGVIGLYISMYDNKKSDYDDAGKKIIQIFNELKALYLEVKALPDGSDFTTYENRLADINGRFYPECISKQILFSNWYAHYKFFWEHQIDWINDELKFGFFRDKVPLSLWFYIVIVLVASILSFSKLMNYICVIQG